MQLSEYMVRYGLKDEAMAQKLRDAGAQCDRTTVTRLRKQKQWLSRELARALPLATEGMVTANDCIDPTPLSVTLASSTTLQPAQ